MMVKNKWIIIFVFFLISFTVEAQLIPHGLWRNKIQSWTPTSDIGALSPRDGMSITWTGTKMFVWGGVASSTYYNDGALYDPATDTWQSISLVGAPSARARHTAVLMGNKVVIWGGADSTGSAVKSGGIYDISTDTWSPITSSSEGLGFGIVNNINNKGFKIDSDRIIFYNGGYATKRFAYIYTLSTDSWMKTPTNAYADIHDSSVIFWGSKLFVWGGNSSAGSVNTGYFYDVNTNTWGTMSTTSAPPVSQNATATIVGSEIIFFGGESPTFYRINTGGRYNPATDTWTSMTSTGAMERSGMISAAHEGRLVVALGSLSTPTRLDIYDPATDSWTSTIRQSPPYASKFVYTGTEFIIWGGWNGTTQIGTGKRTHLP